MRRHDEQGAVGAEKTATSTPITNSVTDAFIMQKYLQSGELGLLDLGNYDNWVGMFAERVTEFEIDVDTSSYRMATRFAKFHNLPELTSLFAQVADFHSLDKTNGIPDFDDYSDALVAKTQDFEDYLRHLKARRRCEKPQRTAKYRQYDVDNDQRAQGGARSTARETYVWIYLSVKGRAVSRERVSHLFLHNWHTAIFPRHIHAENRIQHL